DAPRAASAGQLRARCGMSVRGWVARDARRLTERPDQGVGREPAAGAAGGGPHLPLTPDHATILKSVPDAPTGTCVGVPLLMNHAETSPVASFRQSRSVVPSPL